MEPKLPQLIVIVGPTASGKTEYAVKIAKAFNGEIVSADSRQIYTGMNIGTAKPLDPSGRDPTSNTGLESKEYFYKGIRHHLIDMTVPSKEFSVAQYKRLAIKAIKTVIGRKHLPILVGGTGLYVKALIDNLAIPKVPPQPTLRARLEKELQEKGVQFLFDKLVALDPEAAYIIHPNNPRRIIRALEITITTQKPFSAQRKTKKPLFNALQIGITIPKEKLYKRIDKRIDAMMSQGLLQEAQTLVKQYGEKMQAFDAIGYRELLPYIEDQTGVENGVSLMKQNTRKYAKRQLTWFKKDKRIRWMKNMQEAKQHIRNFLKS